MVMAEAVETSDKHASSGESESAAPVAPPMHTTHASVVPTLPGEVIEMIVWEYLQSTLPEIPDTSVDDGKIPGYNNYARAVTTLVRTSGSIRDLTLHRMLPKQVLTVDDRIRQAARKRLRYKNGEDGCPLAQDAERVLFKALMATGDVDHEAVAKACSEEYQRVDSLCRTEEGKCEKVASNAANVVKLIRGLAAWYDHDIRPKSGLCPLNLYQDWRKLRTSGLVTWTWQPITKGSGLLLE